MLSYHSFHIYETWRSIHRLGEDFKFIMWGQAKGIDPLRHQVNIFIWQLEEG